MGTEHKAVCARECNKAYASEKNEQNCGINKWKFFSTKNQLTEIRPTLHERNNTAHLKTNFSYTPGQSATTAFDKIATNS